MFRNPQWIPQVFPWDCLGWLGMLAESTWMIRGEAFGTLENSHVTLSPGKLLRNMLYWECKAARSMESFLCDLGISQSQKCYPSFIPVTEENCISCAKDTRSQYLRDALDSRCWSMVTRRPCYHVCWSLVYCLWLISESWENTWEKIIAE